MEFRDLKRQYSMHKSRIDGAVLQVLQEGTFIGGGAVGRLEQQLAEYAGVKYCISCANGTDALQLALMAWGIGVGDAVFVPDFTFFSTAEVVALCGATPVFVDVDKETFNMSPASLEKAVENILQNTSLVPRVIIPVDLFGLPAEYNQINHIAEKYQLKVLEDGAQGFGGRIGEQRACSFGEVATTSFFPAKPLGCYGDGGAVFTDDEKINEMLRSLKVHGKGSDKYDNVRIGLNSRLDTLQAAVLSEKLAVFDEFELESINRAAGWYNECLKDVGTLRLPVIPEGMYSSWAQYTVVFPNLKCRDEAQSYLKDHGVPSMVYYKKPLHQQLAFAADGNRTECPVTEALCQTVLSLPIHPYIERHEIEKVAGLLERLA